MPEKPSKFRRCSCSASLNECVCLTFSRFPQLIKELRYIHKPAYPQVGPPAYTHVCQEKKSTGGDRVQPWFKSHWEGRKTHECLPSAFSSVIFHSLLRPRIETANGWEVARIRLHIFTFVIISLGLNLPPCIKNFNFSSLFLDIMLRNFYLLLVTVFKSTRKNIHLIFELWTKNCIHIFSF